MRRLQIVALAALIVLAASAGAHAATPSITSACMVTSGKSKGELFVKTRCGKHERRVALGAPQTAASSVPGPAGSPGPAGRDGTSIKGDAGAPGAPGVDATTSYGCDGQPVALGALPAVCLGAVGPQGQPGVPGPMPTLGIDIVQTLPAGSPATAAIRPLGSTGYALSLGIPKGADGTNGTSGGSTDYELTIGDVAEGNAPAATITTASPGHGVLSLVLPDGPIGPTGENGTSVATTPEPPGVNCPASGARFQTSDGAPPTFACNGADALDATLQNVSETANVPALGTATVTADCAHLGAGAHALSGGFSVPVASDDRDIVRVEESRPESDGTGWRVRFQSVGAQQPVVTHGLCLVPA